MVHLEFPLNSLRYELPVHGLVLLTGKLEYIEEQKDGFVLSDTGRMLRKGPSIHWVNELEYS